MTSLVRRFLKTAILFLVLGLGIGFWMMARREQFLRDGMRTQLIRAHAQRWSAES